MSAVDATENVIFEFGFLLFPIFPICVSFFWKIGLDELFAKVERIKSLQWRIFSVLFFFLFGIDGK